MKSTVEQLSPTRVKLSVEVPFEELEQDFARAYQSLAQQVRIPGFRPGKAPAKLIEARVGRDSVMAQVVNDALPQKYSAAVEETDTKALGQPDIEVADLEYGQPVTFTAEVDVRPDFDLPEYTALSVEVEPVKSDDDAVDEQLKALQQRFGTLVGVDRAVADGDFVSIDMSATVDGEAVEEAATSGLSHEVGSGQLIDGLDEALIGLAVGEEKQFETKLVAGDHAGDDALVTVKVNSVKERELPEVDDDFAQMASEFDTVDELKADLAERVARSGRMQQAGEVRDAVLAKLIETVEIPLPEKVVDAEIEAQLEPIYHSLGHDDAQIEKLFEAQDTTREEFEKQARETAEESITRQLLLDAIADQQETQVSQDELTQQILFQAQQYGMAPQEFINRLQQAGQVGAVYSDVRRGKALASIVNKVAVKDTAGAVVDTDEFFSEPEAEEAAE